MLDFSKYDPGPYPKKPVKPKISISTDANSVYYYDLAKKLEVYEFNLAEHEEQLQLWKDRRDSLVAQFKEDCFDYFKLKDNVIGEKIYKLAVNLGDDFCFEDIYYRLERICDILDCDN